MKLEAKDEHDQKFVDSLCIERDRFLMNAEGINKLLKLYVKEESLEKTLKISNRLHNFMIKNNFDSVFLFSEYTIKDILKYRNIGHNTVQEIGEHLSTLNTSFKRDT